MDDFMERNEGLKSRIPYVVDFPDYDADELTDIFRYMTDKEGLQAVTTGRCREYRTSLTAKHSSIFR